jgi:hypothetical protein
VGPGALDAAGLKSLFHCGDPRSVLVVPDAFGCRATWVKKDG